MMLEKRAVTRDGHFSAFLAFLLEFCMTDSTDKKNLQQVDGLWFYADLVILRAGNRIFRLLTTVLKDSKNRPSMFAFPKPPSPESETVGGVPVANMHDDPAQLEVFLV
jgi:hypothetical protein